MEQTEVADQVCQMCSEAMPFLLTYPLVTTAVLFALLFVFFAKSIWKILVFIPLAVLSAIVLYIFGLLTCRLPESCVVVGVTKFFSGAPLFLINLSLMTLLTFIMAIVPPGTHAFARRKFKTAK